MTKTPTNRLSIYLIKDGYFEPDEILKKSDDIKKEEIDRDLLFCYEESNSHRPSWLTKFFADALSVDSKIFSATSKAMLLAKIKTGEAERYFAVCFGGGRHLLNIGTWEERFGLKVTLNVVDPDHLRGIDKTDISSVPIHASEQMSKEGVVADFGIDIEQDLVKAVRGKSRLEVFGKTITGKDSLHVSTKIDVGNIKEFLNLCFEKYQSEDYKKDFEWVDQIAEIKDLEILNQLNDDLIEKIASEDIGNIWMAVPELILWDDVQGFKYRKRKNDEFVDDISIPDFLDSLEADEKSGLSLELLKDKKIYCFSASAEQVQHSWNAFNCIYSESELHGKTYILNNGKWYEIDKNFADQVNAEYKQLIEQPPVVALPEFNHEGEGEYNAKVAELNPSYFDCMDRKIISYGGGYSKIEFCDLMTSDNKIIHVKPYGGSSVLSHLFSQGIISGELFLADKHFRTKVNEKLSDAFKLADTSTRPDPKNYQIIYAVISRSNNCLELPFFSKVNLRNAKRRLEGALGYDVAVQKIKNVKPKIR